MQVRLPSVQMRRQEQIDYPTICQEVDIWVNVFMR